MRLVFVLALSGMASGCMVFDESMRRSHNDAGTSSSSSSGSGSGGSCTVDAPASAGVDGCGGKGGGTFERSASTGTSIERERAVCGDGPAELTLAVRAGDCVDVFFVGSGAMATITAPGGEAKTASDSAGFHIGADGTLSISVRGTGSWRLVAR